MNRYLIFLYFLLTACGAESNPFTFIVGDADGESFDAEYTVGRAYLDSGDIDKALEHAQNAYAIDKKSELASMLLGYTYLTKAEVAPFDIASRMIAADSEEEVAELLAEESTEDAGADDTLSGLSDLVGLTESDLESLGELDESDPDYPVILPVCAEEARSLVDKLNYVNKAIDVACSFVGKASLIDEEPRHNCEDLSGASNSGKANFLWAFAHLSEALAFHSVLTYSTQTDSSKTNLEMRVESINGADVTNGIELASYIDQVTALEKIVSKVMPSKGECSDEYPQSQMNAMLNDMVTVSVAFGNMLGIPEEMTNSINKSMEKIQELRAKSGRSDEDEASGAFKGDMTAGISKSLGGKINSMSESGQDFSAEETVKVCTAYSSISGGIPDDPNKPSICP